MVPSLKTEPSTLETNIVDGPMSNTGTFHDNAPNHGRSVSRPEPSTLETHIVDGSMPNSGTFHDNASNHGQSDIQT